MRGRSNWGRWGAWTVHAAIFAYRVALLDNCHLDPLSAVCEQERRFEFMLSVAPLVGTAPVSGLSSRPVA